jgi:histidinol phosphatase-like PHP family hydrolase
MELLGIPTLGLVEHVDQLYLPREGFWKRFDGRRREVLRGARDEGHSRHQEFRRRVLPLRSERVLLGLETEAAEEEAGLAILDGDAGHCDHLIGAVHHLGTRERPDLAQNELEEMFLAAVRQLAEAGVNILAHPFRYFPKKRRLASPERLYGPVVELLARHGVAAEINFHTYEPDPAFYALCLRRGVKLALGSDAHGLVEVGELRPHVEFLGRLGALGRLDEVLWRKPASPPGGARGGGT